MAENLIVYSLSIRQYYWEWIIREIFHQKLAWRPDSNVGSRVSINHQYFNRAFNLWLLFGLWSFILWDINCLFFFHFWQHDCNSEIINFIFCKWVWQRHVNFIILRIRLLACINLIGASPCLIFHKFGEASLSLFIC